LSPCFSSSFVCPFFFYLSGSPRDLHSFPTRRSSDLFAGDSLRATVEARYLFGAPMARAAVSWVARQQPISPWALRIPGAEGYYLDRKSTRLNSSHVSISYAVFCLKKKKTMTKTMTEI